MDLSLLKALSEADAIASSEQEVRQNLLEEADRLQKEVRFDGLGSVLIRLNESTGPKVMICAHMDEVGFMVRSISAKGRSMCCRLAMYAWLPASFSRCVSLPVKSAKFQACLTATGRGMTSAPCAWTLARARVTK